MKPGPVIAMVALLLLGAWLVWIGDTIQTRPNATKYELRVANARGVLEAAPGASGALTYRVLLRDGFASPELTAAEVERLFGPDVARVAASRSTNAVFRLFKITTWWSLAWIGVGLAGQLAFSGRTLIQWFISEKRRRSIVPTVFWWLSLAGGVLLFAYFVWRQDIVAVLGQSSGVVIYARNLRLIQKQRRREARAAAPQQPPP